jgi:peptide/nickel transport system permease protein
VSLLIVLALVCIAAVAVVAAFGSFLVPVAPGRQDLLNAGGGPSGDHPFGTDQLGRDILSRLMAGTRPAVIGPLFVAGVAMVVSVSLSLVAGFKGGWTEVAVMRSVDMLFALPGLLVIIVVVGLFGGGYWLAVGMLTLLTIPASTRVIHAAVVSQRNMPYLDAAVVLGVRPRRIMFVHLLPNIMPTVIAAVLLDFVGALVALSSLSFLGLGSPPGDADWGRMLVDNRALLEQNPGAIVAPAVALILTSFSVTVLGDWAYYRLEARRDAGM